MWCLPKTEIGRADVLFLICWYTETEDTCNFYREHRRILETAMTYAQHIFRSDTRYRAKLAFQSDPASTFHAGEIVIFERDTYSPYDDSFVSTFRSETDGRIKEWWLPDHEPQGTWQQFFEVCDDQRQPKT